MTNLGQATQGSSIKDWTLAKKGGFGQKRTSEGWGKRPCGSCSQSSTFLLFQYVLRTPSMGDVEVVIHFVLYAPQNIVWVSTNSLHRSGSQGEVVYMTHISAHLSSMQIKHLCKMHKGLQESIQTQEKF